MADDFQMNRNNPDSLHRGQPTLGVIGTAGPARARGVVFAADCTFDSTNETAGESISAFPALKGSVVPFIPGKVTATSPSTVFWWV